MNTKKLSDFSKKQPIALSCVIIAVVLAVAIYYRADTLAETQAKFEAKTAEWEHIRDNVKNSDQLTEQFTALTQAIQGIESRLVHADRLAINLQYFYKLESETHTKLTDLRQSGVNASKGAHKTVYSGIGYAVAAQGSYPQLMDFLRRIENSEHFSHINGLTLTQAGGGETAVSSTDLSLRLDIELLGVP